MEKRILLEKRGREANQVNKASVIHILPIFPVYRYLKIPFNYLNQFSHSNIIRKNDSN